MAIHHQCKIEPDEAQVLAGKSSQIAGTVEHHGTIRRDGRESAPAVSDLVEQDERAGGIWQVVEMTRRMSALLPADLGQGRAVDRSGAGFSAYHLCSVCAARSGGAERCLQLCRAQSM